MISVTKKLLPAALKSALKKSYRMFWQSIASFSRKVVLPPGGGDAYRLLFVCKGNVCRSAFAEHYLESRGLPEGVKVDSCGLEVERPCGSPADAVKVAAEFGVDLSPHYAKSIQAVDVSGADMIILMEFDQYLEFVRQFPEKKENAFVLRKFHPLPGGVLCNIYDPFGQGEKSFRSCFQIMEKALDGLITRVAARDGEFGQPLKT